jgi:SAM-dependent methyltransferase
MQKNQSEINRKAWSYRAYEFWTSNNGLPGDCARAMMAEPEKFLRRHIEFLGDVKGKKIANLLGSNGRKAISLALLGADVTIVDISAENQKYAMELAREAGVNITYLVSDFLELDISELKDCFDIVFLEGGILHYFSDLYTVADKIYELMKTGGKLVLNDFHPFRKILKVRDIFEVRDDNLELTGDYFEKELVPGEVAYQKYFPMNEQNEFSKCLLRYWTMGEIISSFAAAGFIIEKLAEGPRFDSHKNISGEFTLVASKHKIASAS